MLQHTGGDDIGVPFFLFCSAIGYEDCIPFPCDVWGTLDVSVWLAMGGCGMCSVWLWWASVVRGCMWFPLFPVCMVGCCLCGGGDWCGCWCGWDRSWNAVLLPSAATMLQVSPFCISQGGPLHAWCASLPVLADPTWKCYGEHLYDPPCHFRTCVANTFFCACRDHNASHVVQRTWGGAVSMAPIFSFPYI